MCVVCVDAMGGGVQYGAGCGWVTAAREVYLGIVVCSACQPVR